MGIIGHESDEQIVKNYAIQRAHTSSLKSEAQSLLDEIDRAGSNFALGDSFELVRKAVSIEIAEESNRVTVAVDDRVRQALTPSGLREAFAFSFGSAPFDVDFTALSDFTSLKTSLNSNLLVVGSPPIEQRLVAPDGGLSLVTVFGRPTRIVASDSWLLNEPNASLESKVSFLLNEACNITRKVNSIGR